MKPLPVRRSALSPVRRFGAALALTLSLFTLPTVPAFAAGMPFVVNSSGDTSDKTKGDGVCDDGSGN